MSEDLCVLSTDINTSAAELLYEAKLLSITVLFGTAILPFL
jgi:hypothetical protein